MALVPDPVVLVDLEGRIAGLNAPAERLLGFTQAELEGQLIDAVLTEGVRALRDLVRIQASAYAPAAASASPLMLRLRRKDGTGEDGEATAQLVSSASGPMAALFLR